MNKDFWKEWNERIDALPELIMPPLAPQKINASFAIYQGKFKIHLETSIVELTGEIYFSYRPKPGVRFKGTGDYYSPDFNIIKIEINGKSILHGHAFITHVGESDHEISGIINNPMVIFESAFAAKEFTSCLPNFQELLGLPVRSGNKMVNNRMVFENDQWLIKVDLLPATKMLKKEVKAEGGYLLSHGAKVVNKTTTFDYHKSVEIISDLGLFFTFLNGCRSFPGMIQATANGQICWNDFSAFHADTYNEEYSWLPQKYDINLSELWFNYYSIVRDKNDRECMDFLIHWYVEANNNSGFAEGSVVFLQNAFELLFNWQIVEKLGQITVKQAKKMSAAEKLRNIMRQAKLPLGFSAKYQNLIEQLSTQGIAVQDFPELFTRLRNSIVHANENKRQTLQKIPSMARFHIRQMGIHCLELLILHVLGYRGVYANRISENPWSGGNEELVPWMLP